MLSIEGLDAKYGDVQVLYDVSLEVDEGDIVALIGANGAGKTTLLKVISSMLRPARGTVTFCGERMDRLPPHKVVEAGLVQIPEGRKLFPSLTVLENLELGSFTPRAKKQRAESIKKVFQMFPRLEERKIQKAGTLSGGEQQMLAVGRGLMCLPKLLMLDEPSLGLAPMVVQAIFDTVKAINSQGMTVLLVEQNVKHSLALSSRAYVLENGRVVLAGASQELMGDDHVRKAYLGV